MRKIILMFLLAGVSSSAMASDWVSIDSLGDKEQHVFEYADNGSIVPRADIRLPLLF
ncbi:MAG: hypothetical protein ACHP65_10190 [Legionellales bacterium]